MAHKRKNYLEWQEYFMSIAFLSAQRSKDPTTQVGACIVNKENKVVGIGYNGMPIGCDDDVMPWNKLSDYTSKESWLNSKLPYVCHAELNAVLNKNCADVKGCIIYVALFPCNLCSQIIIQSGITEVVYYCDKDPEKPETKAAKYLLDLAGITYRQFVPKQSQVEINFSLIEATTGTLPTPTSQQQLLNGDVNISESVQERIVGSKKQKETNGTGVLSTKRSNYLEWEEYFMTMAFLSAQRSKDPRTQVGACIVNKEKKIVGIGYNGMPIGCNDDIMPWNRAADASDVAWLESKSPYVCHAELNAVLNKNSADIKGCTIYVALFPCNKCAQVVIQSGIKEVVYYSDKYHHQPEFNASRHMLSTAGILYRQFRPRQEKIIIDYGINSRDRRTKSQTMKEQADSSTDELGKVIAVSKQNGKEQDSTSGLDALNNKAVCAGVVTNNNNIGKADPYPSLDDHLGPQHLMDQNNPNNVTVNDHTLKASLELGWLNEVQEIRFVLISLFVAAFVVLLSW